MCNYDNSNNVQRVMENYTCVYTSKGNTEFLLCSARVLAEL